MSERVQSAGLRYDIPCTRNDIISSKKGNETYYWKQIMYNAHTEPLFKELSTLTLSDILKLQCLKLYYKYVHGTLPTYFNGFFTENYELHHHYTRPNRHIHVPATCSLTAQNCSRYFISKLLRSLPNLVTDKLHTHSYGGFSITHAPFSIVIFVD